MPVGRFVLAASN